MHRRTSIYTGLSVFKKVSLEWKCKYKAKIGFGLWPIGSGVLLMPPDPVSGSLLPWPLSWFTSLLGRFSSKMWPLSKFRLTYPELLWLAENYLPCVSLNGSSFKSLSLCLGEMLIPIPVSVARGRGFPDQSLSHDVPNPELTQEKNQSQSFPMFWGWERKTHEALVPVQGKIKDWQGWRRLRFWIVILAEEEVKTNSTSPRRKLMCLKYWILPHLAFNLIQVLNRLCLSV